MGNFLSIASLTVTMSYLLEEVNRDVSGVKITTRPLDAIDIQNPVNGINIFLYLVTPASALDSVDSLMTDSSGKTLNNPYLRLDLNYIITATSSDNDDLVAQKILASAMKVLNEHPVITSETIRNATRNKEGFESSDLPDQIETVRLNLNALSTEEIAKIWARFPNANFRPSVAYTAQSILLESKLTGPEGTMGSISLDGIGQLRSPTIERLEPQVLEYSPNATLVIVGNNLQAPSVTIEFDDHVMVSTTSEGVSDNRIVAMIPSELEPGMVKVKINHLLSPVRDEGTIGRRSVLSSNASPFVLAPRILTPRQAKVSRGKVLVVDFEPPVSNGKTVFVYLGDNAYTATPVKKAGSNHNGKVGSVAINIPEETVNGVYLLRVAVDGAASRLIKDDNPHSPTFGKYISPYVEIFS
jgi:hypothetical protein